MNPLYLLILLLMLNICEFKLNEKNDHHNHHRHNNQHDHHHHHKPRQHHHHSKEHHLERIKYKQTKYSITRFVNKSFKT